MILVIILSFLLVGFLSYYLINRLNRYLEKKYKTHLSEWKSFWIVVGSLALTVVLYFLSVIDTTVSSSLVHRIAGAKSDHQKLIQQVIEEEHNKYLNDLSYVNKLGGSFTDLIFERIQNREEFAKKFLPAILKLRKIPSEVPQATIDQITKEYRDEERQKGKFAPLYTVALIISFFGGIVFLIWHNFRLIPNIWLAVLISILKYIWALLLICGILLIVFIVGLVLGLREEEKQRKYKQMDKLNENLSKIEKHLRSR